MVKSNEPTPLEKFQAIEYAQCKNDILYFIETYVKIPSPVSRNVYPELRSYQKNMIDIYQHNSHVAGLIARQMGTTMTTLSYLLWKVIFHPDKSVLLVSNTMRSSEDLLRRMMFSYDSLPDFIKSGISIKNKNNITFNNRSRVIALSINSKSLRGTTLTDVYCDNFAYTDHDKALDFYQSIIPCVANRPDSLVILTSTANFETDLFAKIWMESVKNGYGKVGPNGFYGFKVTWNADPNRDSSFKEEMVNMMGERHFRTEYECEFITEV